MGKIVSIHKTTTSEAILVDTPEEEAAVRQWLSEMFQFQIDGISAEDADELAKAQELKPVTDERVWFVRDRGNPLVYLIAPESFVVDFEILSERDIDAPAPAYDDTTNSFTFEEN